MQKKIFYMRWGKGFKRNQVLKAGVAGRYHGISKLGNESESKWNVWVDIVYDAGVYNGEGGTGEMSLAEVRVRR